MSAPVTTLTNALAWPEQLRGTGIIPRLVVDVPGRLHEVYEPLTLDAFARIFGAHAAAIETMQHVGATLTAALVIDGTPHLAFVVRYERRRGRCGWRCTQHAGRA